MSNKISTPLVLKSKLAGTNDLQEATSILRRCEWKLIVEMRKTFLHSMSFGELTPKNETLLSLCSMHLEWVQHFHGGSNQSIIDKGLDAHSIDELLKPYESLAKLNKAAAQMI